MANRLVRAIEASTVRVAKSLMQCAVALYLNASDKQHREAMMIRLQSGLFIILLLGLAGSHAKAEEVWSLDGFKAPESVLFDAKRNVFYVSNIAGDLAGRDGVGYLSKVSPDGKLQAAEWVTGFNAPKGLVMQGDTLFVT
ncbi:MAG: hypothetical protein E5X64_19990, partial [Mesorhizobium sp.]